MAESTNDTALSERLTRIQTQWTVVLEAHGESTAAAQSARKHLLEKYSGAVYRYLLGAVRDPETAEELANEFAVRLLQGKFARATPAKGRFRDYIKTVLINLVNDHFKSRRDSPRQFLSAEVDPAAPDLDSTQGSSFEDCLHEQLLTQAWEALERANPKYHLVLLAKVENSEMSSAELATQLSGRLGKTASATWIRKTLERARAKFAQLLVEQVRETLACSSQDELRTELQALRLLPYCRSALGNSDPDQAQPPN